MTAPHNPNLWMADQRTIEAAQLVDSEGAYTLDLGCQFERFERSGEMAMIPYLRVTWNGLTTEAPLRNWAWVSFREDANAEV